MEFRSRFSARIYLLSLIEAVIAAGCYVGALFLIAPIDAPVHLLYENGAYQIGLITATYLVASYLFDFYKQIHVSSRLVLILQVAQLIGIVLIVQSAIAFGDRVLVLQQIVVLTGSAATLIAISAWRLFLRPGIWNAIGAHRVVTVGHSAAAARLAHAFRTQPMLGMEIVGYVRVNTLPPGAEPCLGDARDLWKIVQEVKPNRVIVSADDLKDKGVLKTLFDLRSSGVQVESAGDLYEAIFGRVYSPSVEPYTVIFRNELSAPAGSVALQSIYTNLIALVAIVVTFPFLLLIAILLKFTGGGNALSSQPCAGLHGIPFNRFAFRCGSNRMGRVLRRLRMDCLPQILNIVRGEMALIGPRPEQLQYNQLLEELIPFYRQKQSVKPGVLGWSQLHCDGLPFEDTLARIEYDLYYIKHISLVLDAYIMLRAVKWLLLSVWSGEEVRVVESHRAVA